MKAVTLGAFHSVQVIYGIYEVVRGSVKERRERMDRWMVWLNELNDCGCDHLLNEITWQTFSSADSSTDCITPYPRHVLVRMS